VIFFIKNLMQGCAKHWKKDYSGEAKFGAGVDPDDYHPRLLAFTS